MINEKWPMKNDPAISVQNVSKTFRIPHEKISTIRGAFVSAFREKTYESFKALDNVSFEVKKGEFFGIIGRNGSGKSTLLKILAGIYSADKGDIKINGRISPFLELGIGFNPELSGRDNIYLNATVLGLTKKQVDEKFDDIVAFSELGRFIDQKVKNYSSGMQVRLAFSVAIHANRDILLMDEVLAVGDTNFQSKCLGIFRKLRKEGKTIILVTHDLESVKEFCDRVALLDMGKIITVSGPEKAIYEYSQIMMDETKSAKKTRVEMSSQEIEEESKLKLKNEKHRKNQNRVVEVKLFNSQNKGVDVFEGGEDIIIRVIYDVKKVENEMYASIGIYDKKTNELVSGNNMFFENIYKKWKKGRNEVKLIFKDNYFNKGDFFVSSTFFKGNPKDNKIYDYFSGKERNEFFKVIPKNRHNSIMYLPHDWKY